MTSFAVSGCSASFLAVCLGKGNLERRFGKLEQVRNSSGAENATEAEISGRAVGGVGGAGGDAVPVTIGKVAEIGAAFHDFSVAFGRTAGIVGGSGEMVGRTVPIGTPFPDISRHV